MDYMSIPFFYCDTSDTESDTSDTESDTLVHNGTEKQWQNSGKTVAKTFQRMYGKMFLGIVVYFNGRITVSKTVDIGSTPIITAKL